jgi:hypothetical protein
MGIISDTIIRLSLPGPAHTTVFNFEVVVYKELPGENRVEEIRVD